ncbi:MAG: hypothetical protein U0263_19545 [Polyangiaceae bacterium]
MNGVAGAVGALGSVERGEFQNIDDHPEEVDRTRVGFGRCKVRQRNQLQVNVDLSSAFRIDVLLEVAPEQSRGVSLDVHDVPHGCCDSGSVLLGRTDQDVQVVRELDGLPEHAGLASDDDEIAGMRLENPKLVADVHAKRLRSAR